jgi:acetyl-CoA acyltransferase 1
LYFRVADRIRSGAVAVGIGCGVESMTHTEMKTAAPVVSWAAVRACSAALSCTLPMGVTSDNLARMFGIRRQAQDCFAAESHRRAAASTGALSREIVAVGGVTADDGVRGDCSPEALATLTPAFTQEGTTTAGNASQVSDGAAAVLLASESVARALGAPVLGVWLAYCAVGVDPSLMGIGPAAAIPRALRLAGLEVGDVDVFEINEAFASQCLYCIDSLGRQLVVCVVRMYLSNCEYVCLSVWLSVQGYPEKRSTLGAER